MRSIHNVFHVSLIKEYKSDGRTQPPPAPDIIGDLPEFTVQKSLKHRHVHTWCVADRIDSSSWSAGQDTVMSITLGKRS